MARPFTLVTGGAGFIGRHLVRQLAEDGARVRVLDIALPDAPGALEGAEEIVQGSVMCAEVVAAAVQGVDEVYHLAGDPNLWRADKRHFEAVNLGGTQTVIDAAWRAGVERIVHTSTESILKSYKQRLGGGLIDESVQLGVGDMPGPYCRSKFLAEQSAIAAARRGVPVVIVNPTLPVGPGDANLTPPTRMIVDFLNGRHPAYLDCQFNMIDVRDVARGHILAMKNGRVGERYILGNTNLSLSALLALMGESTGLPMPTTRVPYPVAWSIAVLCEFIADRLTGRPPVAPLTGVRLAGSPMVFDCTKAETELGLECRPLRQSLADTVAWAAATGLLRAERMPAGFATRPARPA